MQDEEIDKIINDAANQHHPPYSDKDWDKMLQLLNKHLPQQKDRRRPLFLILLLLLLTGGVVTVIMQPWKKTATTTYTKTETTENNSTSEAEKLTTNDLPVQNKKNNTGNTVSTPATGNQTQQTNTTSGNNLSLQGNDVFATSNTVSSKEITTTSVKRVYGKSGKTKVKITAASIGFDNAENEQKPAAETRKTSLGLINKHDEANTKITIEKDKETIITTMAIVDKANTNAISPNDSIKAPNAKIIDTSAVNIAKATTLNNSKKQQRFADNFAITLSAGGDVSYISISNAGKLKTFYGAGLSYILNKRLRISSSIMVSQKIYTAKPGQYKLPYGTNYPHLQKIDAVCKIYEIPFSVYYNFAQKNKHNWFAGTGISSYIMKNEAYDYVNKSPTTGQTYSWKKTVANKNNHLLSVLTLSGGYQYTVSKRFSFMAEPYLKIPLSGVGEGKVKLNSTGMLLTMTVKPFSK